MAEYFDCFKDFNDLFKIYSALDLLIYTPLEWENKKTVMLSPGFGKSAGESLLKFLYKVIVRRSKF